MNLRGVRDSITERSACMTNEILRSELGDNGDHGGSGAVKIAT
jgi:hypothetical protein